MGKRLANNERPATLVLALFVASARLLAADGGDHRYSDWSAPVNLGPTVNTAFTEFGSFISRDGRSLYFGSDRPGGFGGIDIWVAQRSNVDDSWGPAQNLGATINTSFSEQAPTLSIDGHWLYFFSDRPGGFGSLDLYVSRRHNKRDDFAWRLAENLGNGVNTAAGEHAPAHFEDDVTGIVTLYFASNRPGGMGDDDIYASTLQPDGTFGSVVPVEELNGPFTDRHPCIRRDGLEMFLASNRPGTIGAIDLWVATRATTSDPWSVPENLGPVVNNSAIDARAALSFKATELYFQSTRPGGLGGFDLYRSTRTKLREPD